MNVVITIAGSDSGGGAGIQADLKTFEALGVFGTTAITSITAQNTLGVRAVFDLPADMVRAQLEALFDDFSISAIKIGMLSNREIISAVSAVLRDRVADIPVVLDPVMVATSGDRLIQEDAVSALREELIPLVTLVTPNAAEAEILSGRPVNSLEEMMAAAPPIWNLGAEAVLIKGGHVTVTTGESGSEGRSAVDVLFDGADYSTFSSPYIESDNTHGTGCTLSSAIAAYLACGMALEEAVELGKDYVRGAIEYAPALGQGHGPLLHRWRAAVSAS